MRWIKWKGKFRKENKKVFTIVVQLKKEPAKPGNPGFLRSKSKARSQRARGGA